MRRDTELTTINVSLPRSQRDFVEEEAARSGCTTTSEYMRRLIHDAQRRSSQEALDRKLLEGLDSGVPVAVTPEYLARKRREVTARSRRKKPT